MKNIFILVIEICIIAVIMFFGITGKQFFFINSSRTAVLTLGTIGMFFCMISIFKFIKNSPFHALSVLAYFVGSIALTCFVTQLFNLKLPIVANPTNALLILAISIIIKGIIARFGDVLIK